MLAKEAYATTWQEDQQVQRRLTQEFVDNQFTKDVGEPEDERRQQERRLPQERRCGERRLTQNRRTQDRRT